MYISIVRYNAPTEIGNAVYNLLHFRDKIAKFPPKENTHYTVSCLIIQIIVKFTV